MNIYHLGALGAPGLLPAASTPAISHARCAHSFRIFTHLWRRRLTAEGVYPLNIYRHRRTIKRHIRHYRLTRPDASVRRNYFSRHHIRVYLMSALFIGIIGY